MIRRLIPVGRATHKARLLWSAARLLWSAARLLWSAARLLWSAARPGIVIMSLVSSQQHQSHDHELWAGSRAPRSHGRRKSWSGPCQRVRFGLILLPREQ